MSFFGHDITFWVALLGATAIRVFTSPFHSIFRAAVMVFISVFMAWLLTEPVVDWMRLDPAVYKAPIGGLIALSADGVVRLGFEFLRNPSAAVDLYRRWKHGPGKDGK